MKKIILSFLSVVTVLISVAAQAQTVQAQDDCVLQCTKQLLSCLPQLEQKCLGSDVVLSVDCKSIANILYNTECKNGGDCTNSSFSASDDDFKESMLCARIISQVDLSNSSKVCEEACVNNRFP